VTNPSSADRRIELRSIASTSPFVREVLQALDREYHQRYADLYDGSLAGPAESDIDFPGGDFIALFEDDQVVAAGAWTEVAERTAEVKRMWTRDTHRRLGLASRVLSALERSAVDRGHTDIVLTSGDRQPEALSLYEGAGYLREERPSSTDAPQVRFSKRLRTAPALQASDGELVHVAAIDRTLRAYSIALDRRRWDYFYRAFHPEASIDFTGLGGAVFTPHGLRAALVSADETRLAGQHLLANTEHEIDGDTARTVTEFAVVTWQRTDVDHEVFRVRSTGWYEDDLRLFDQGWRITRRTGFYRSVESGVVPVDDESWRLVSRGVERLAQHLR